MRFRRNPLFEAQAKADPRYKAALAAQARIAAAAVRQAAPHLTGAYARSITTDGNIVLSTDPFAHLVEYGSRNNPAHAPMRRGIRAAGLRLDEVLK